MTVIQRQTNALEPTVIGPLLEELRKECQEHRFSVAPNPCVGAAIISGDRVVARGFHERWGSAHAEVNAMNAARAAGVDEAEWDAIIVTLEPCSSEGKTPPCLQAILDAGIPRVGIGAVDPDPRHSGAAVSLMEEAGLEVCVFQEPDTFEEENAAFCGWVSPDRVRAARPWTIAKWAQTRTGQLSPPEDVGEGRWISGPESLAEVQVLRGEVDAILTGVGTLKSDDPRLSLRSPGTGEAPLRVVLDSYLRTPTDAALFRAPGTEESVGEVVILTLAGADGPRWRALEESGARVVGLRGDEEDRVSLVEVHLWLWEQGLRRVLLEAGPRLLESHFERDLIDQVRVYTGDVFGGEGVSLGHTLAGLSLAARLDRESGQDAVLEGFLLQED
ncbi:MAG: riboflavin biosynthesis protein RibD [Deltaproteobacteria bacterium]|nr:riboflavin biosynthesis protein RibD [Deltaproteobacteria bacterium]